MINKHQSYTLIRISFILAVFFIAGHSIFAQGGPPMLTDDPVTLEKGDWEINNAFVLEHTSISDNFELPLVDVNYGLTDKIQLKYELPLLFKHEYGSSMITSLGKSLLGVKWKFFEDEKSKFSMSTYPQFGFNNSESSSERGITEEGIRLLIPLMFMKEIDKSAIVVELGRGLSFHSSGNWIYGSLYSLNLSNSICVAAEMYGDSDYTFSENEVFLNAGIRAKLSKHFSVLFSIGSNVILHNASENKLITYLGLQLCL